MTDEAPFLAIVLRIEARPRFVTIALEDEEERLVDWLGSRPELLDLIDRALHLAVRPPSDGDGP